jgi:hypothetical protein
MLLGRSGGVNEIRRYVQSLVGRKRSRGSIPDKGATDLSLLQVSRQALIWNYPCIQCIKRRSVKLTAYLI